MFQDDRFSFHHLGLACRSIEVELKAWTQLGYRLEGAIFEDPIQKIRGIFVAGGGPRLELLEPSGDGSPVAGFIARGVKLYHQAFMASHFDEALADFAKIGGKVVAGPSPAVAFGGRRIAFVMAPGMNLIEIIDAA